MIVEVPVRLLSPNETSGEHWSARKRRRDQQHEWTAFALRAAYGIRRPRVPALVTITRISPSKTPLDDDNLAHSAKHLRDAIALFLGVDDGDLEKVRWRYRQERTTRRGYHAALVSICPMEQLPAEVACATV